MRNKEPNFTVLMSVYKNDDPIYFEKALSSVFSNTLQPTTFLLVVDGNIPISLHNTIDRYKHYSYFKVIYLTSNLGLAEALNAGIKKITTDWIIRADADDINHKNRFEVLFREMHGPFDLIGSSIREINKQGQVLGERSTPLTATDILTFMSRRNPFNHMSVAYRTNIINKCDGYPSIYLREDYALWIKMTIIGARMKNIPDILVDATTGNEMYARRGGIKYSIGEYRLQKLLVSSGIKPPFRGVIDGALRAIVFIGPQILRKFIYERFLRKKLFTK